MEYIFYMCVHYCYFFHALKRVSFIILTFSQNIITRICSVLTHLDMTYDYYFIFLYENLSFFILKAIGKFPLLIYKLRFASNI